MTLPAAAVTEYARRQARSHLEDFTRYTMPTFVWGWFNLLLCQILEDFYDELLMGNSPRYMVFAPPRGGKTELVSRRFPAWVMGFAPSTPIIGTSYAATLATRNSRDIQRIISSPSYGDIFPNTCLPTRKTEGVCMSDIWEPVDRHGRLHGGSYVAAGVEGGITGQGFQIGLIDDPVKDYAEASSKLRQEAIWEWYQTTFNTRRDPQMHGTFVIQTRWHRHDLSGKLLDEMNKGSEPPWKVFSFPMECEEDVELFNVGGRHYQTRKKGDILFPERMSQSFVESCKGSPLTWAALYQQRPTVEGGNFFKGAWWEYYEEAPSPFERMIITVDTAQKKGEENDFSVFQVWGRKGGKIYLVEQIRGKWESQELLAMANPFWREWGGGTRGPIVKCSAMFVEDKSSGTGLIQDLRNLGVPVIAIPRTKDKMTRAVDKQARFAARLICLPRYKPWLNEFLMEFEDFSVLMNHAHDDQVDAALDAVDILLDGGGGLDYSAMNGE